MSLSIHVVGYRPPDARWNEMKAIYEACSRAKINIPEEVNSFFGFDDPSDKPGMEVPLTKEVLQKYEGEYKSGYEVDVSRLPSDVRFIRFYISG